MPNSNEPNERITALETNMAYVLSILAKREEYQNNVLVKLTTIELKQDQALTYQKTCDAERSAHGSRIGAVENAVNDMAKITNTLEDHAGQLALIQKHIIRSSTIWWMALKIGGLITGIAVCAAAGAEIWRH